jgi:hypothetical protein
MLIYALPEQFNNGCIPPQLLLVPLSRVCNDRMKSGTHARFSRAP